MARINFDASKHIPKGNEDRIPAQYSRLDAARKRAVRERYVDLQDGKCYHCSCTLGGQPSPDVLALKVNWARFPGAKQGFLRHPVHLHHDHKTGLTLGAVHAYCNAVLWQYHGE